MTQLAALKMNPDFLNRDVNANFSGGEKKRNEILQLSVLEVRPRVSASVIAEEQCLSPLHPSKDPDSVKRRMLQS